MQNNWENHFKAIDEKVAEGLDRQKVFQRKYYLERREWQLQQFGINWTPDWSRDELLFHLKKLRKTMKRLSLRNPSSHFLIQWPMVETAYLVECELAEQEAA